MCIKVLMVWLANIHNKNINLFPAPAWEFFMVIGKQLNASATTLCEPFIYFISGLYSSIYKCQQST